MAGFDADDYALAAEALREKAGRSAGEAAGRERELADRFDRAAAGLRPAGPVSPPAPAVFAGLRLGTLVLRLTIAALVLSALIAIAGLLTGSFSEAEGRVLLAVVSIWVFSLAFLAGARAASRRGAARTVGLAAQALAVVALGFSLGLIVAWDAGEAVVRAFWGVVIVAISTAHASYLLGWTVGRDSTFGAVVAATLAAAAVLAALLLAVVAGYGGDPPEWYWRPVGVFAILTALGDVLLPVLARLRLSAGRSGR